MSDESAAPPAPEPVPPSAMPPRTAGSPGVRPAGRKAAPPPSPRKPSNLKKYLVLGIIGSSALLIGVICWRVVALLTKEPVKTRNVKAEWENAWQEARAANKEIFEKIEAKVWTKGEALTADDLAKVKAGLATYEKTSETYHELLEQMQKQGKLNSQEAADMGATQIILKIWVWDARGVLDPASKPPTYAGLYIPMYQAEKRRDDAVKRLAEIKAKAQEIVSKGDAAEIEATVKEVRGLIDRFAAIRDELLQLDDDLLKGLTLPDLKKEQAKDLEELRSYQNLASMGIKEAREVRALFPAQDTSPRKEEPPKEETPKPGEPKPEPPKAEKPPKEEPPKSETPPKEEPPKETPK